MENLKKNGIVKLNEGNVTYEKEKNLAVVLNRCFYEVFTEEAESADRRTNEHVRFDKEELKKLMANLEGRKYMGPETILGPVLKVQY